MIAKVVLVGATDLMDDDDQPTLHALNLTLFEHSPRKQRELLSNGTGKLTIEQYRAR